MAINFCATISIVVVNKSLYMRVEGVRFETLIAGLNFLATAIGVRVCHAVGMYENKPLGQLQVRFTLTIEVKSLPGGGEIICLPCVHPFQERGPCMYCLSACPTYSSCDAVGILSRSFLVRNYDRCMYGVISVYLLEP